MTLIKAIFDDTAPLRRRNVTPPPFTDEKGIVTVGGKLDKLASNAALGRNFGGVHYRSEGEHVILPGGLPDIIFL